MNCMYEKRRGARRYQPQTPRKLTNSTHIIINTLYFPLSQTVYVHEATGTKRWDRPTAADDVTSDIAARQQQHAAQ